MKQPFEVGEAAAIPIKSPMCGSLQKICSDARWEIRGSVGTNDVGV